MSNEVTECTIPISEFLSLRLYSDTRPHYQHIAELQKGLILVYRGTELVGEGTGFGVPIVRCRDKTYFSGSSSIQIFQKGNRTTIIKHFVLNMIPEKQFRKVKVENKMIRKLTIWLDKSYMKNKRLRLFFLINLSKSIGLQTHFTRAKPIGNITVTYCIDYPCIGVKADFKLLTEESAKKIFLLNEQGSRYFKEYYDSDGTVLFDKNIGAWERVESNWAGIFKECGEIGFRLWKIKGAQFYRGREFLEGFLDWVGLDYEISSEKNCFEYDIEILERPKKK